MDFARDGVKVDAVEINSAVVPVAREFFHFDPTKVNVTIGDGRYFVNRSAKKYDAIVLDAFLGDSCPSHLMTREAFTAMRRILQPEGVLVINTFADPDLQQDFFSASLYKTLTNTFTSVRLHHGRNGNSLFVASARPQLAILHPPDYARVYEGFIQGGNHPDDVEGMATLFRRFGWLSYMQRAIDIWTRGDEFIARLAAAGTALHAELSRARPDQRRLAAIAAELDAINTGVRPLEDDFSATLGAAGRISGVTPAALTILLKYVKRRSAPSVNHGRLTA